MTGEWTVRRAKRSDLEAIATLVTKASHGQVSVDQASVLDWLFSKGLMVVLVDGLLEGVMAWQTENLVSVSDLFCVWPVSELTTVGEALLTSVEAELQTLMCEANVIVLSRCFPDAVQDLLREQGYEHKGLGELHRIWREVLGDFLVEDAGIMVKRLRDKMIMAPL